MFNHINPIVTNFWHELLIDGHCSDISRAKSLIKGLDIDAEYDLISDGQSTLSEEAQRVVVAISEKANPQIKPRSHE